MIRLVAVELLAHMLLVLILASLHPHSTRCFNWDHLRFCCELKEGHLARVLVVAGAFVLFQT